MIGRNEFAEQPVRLRASLLCTCAIILSGCSNDDASNGDEDFGPRPVNPEQTRYLVHRCGLYCCWLGGRRNSLRGNRSSDQSPRFWSETLPFGLHAFE